MKTKTFGRTMILAATLFLTLGAGSSAKDVEPAPKEPWIEPSTITASQPFLLTLHFEEDQCNFDYLNVWAGVNVETRVITLLYERTMYDSPRMCLYYMTAGPTFNIEGLPPGSYTIEHGVGPGCAIPSDTGGPLCKYYITRQKLSQKLVVRDSVPSEKKYWFNPSVAPANENFVLAINSSFEQCNVTYSTKSVQVDEQTKSLYLYYTPKLTPMQCNGPMQPQGFDIPALDAGSYSVYMSFNPRPIIPGGPLWQRPVPWKLEQTLEVVKDSAVTRVWFEPDTISSDSAVIFTLHFSEDQCQKAYRSMSVTVDHARKEIYLNYVDLGNILSNYCKKPLTRGPQFSLGKLAAGTYKLFYTAWPSCAIPVKPGDQACEIYVTPTEIQKRLVVKNSGSVGVQHVEKTKTALSGLYIDRQTVHIRGIDTHGSAVINIFDARGRRVAHRLLKGENSLTLSSLSLRSGVYLARVISDNKTQLQHKFIIR